MKEATLHFTSMDTADTAEVCSSLRDDGGANSGRLMIIGGGITSSCVQQRAVTYPQAPPIRKWNYVRTRNYGKIGDEAVPSPGGDIYHPSPGGDIYNPSPGFLCFFPSFFFHRGDAVSSIFLNHHFHSPPHPYPQRAGHAITTGVIPAFLLFLPGTCPLAGSIVRFYYSLSSRCYLAPFRSGVSTEICRRFYAGGWGYENNYREATHIKTQ